MDAQRILVVDDDPDILTALRDVLEEAGYVVDTAANGLVALERLDNGLRPVLIILDFMMPTMDGHTFRREQLTRREVAGVPVLGLTANVRLRPEPGDEFEIAFKPISLARLLERVRRLAGEPTPVPGTLRAPVVDSVEHAVARAREVRSRRFWRRMKILVPLLAALAGLARVLLGR